MTRRLQPGSLESPRSGTVLVVTSSYPTDSDDYRGLFVRRFAEALGAAGRPVEVVAPSPGGRDTPNEPRRPAAETPDVHWLGRGPGGTEPFGRLYGGDGIANNLRRHPLDGRHLLPSMQAMGAAICARARDADAVVAHWLMPAGLVAAATKLRHRRPVWIVCHSGGVRLLARAPRPIRHWTGSLLARRADLVSCVSGELRDLLLRAVGPHADRLRDRCRILPMGVDVDRFASVHTSASGPIAVVARLTRLKAIDRLLCAASRSNRLISLRIIGDGPERRRLQRFARRHHLDVDFLGAVPPQAVPQLLDGCSLAALPSRRLSNGRTEGLPTFALEALAAGLPLLTTDCWQMPERLARAPGVFRVPDSLDGLAEGLERALGYAGRQPSANATQRMEAVREYDWRQIGARAARLLGSLRSRSAPAWLTAFALGARRSASDASMRAISSCNVEADTIRFR